ncbi:MAG: hypothetical protein Kow0010_24150 [Dehalococcoidia bacterium]
MNAFERIARLAFSISDAPSDLPDDEHPFATRNIDEGLPAKVRDLFDDGHYTQATFEAFKFVDEYVRSKSGVNETGFKLMMRTFDPEKPVIALNGNTTMSERDEQDGFRFLFAGSMLAIRNPRGHDTTVSDGPDVCLDHLALASLLLRRLRAAEDDRPAVEG